MSKSIRTMLEEYNQVSMKKLAAATEISYGTLLRAAKAPIPGEIYNAETVNYAALDGVFTRAKIDIEKLPWADLNTVSNTVKAMITGFTLGSEFRLRADEETYKIVYMTESHVIFQGVSSTQPRVMNNDTFLHQGPWTKSTPAPVEVVKEPRLVKKV